MRAQQILLVLAGWVVLIAPLCTRAETSPEPGTEQQLDDKNQELEDLRYRIKASRRKAKQLAADEKQQMARLAELDREKALTEELLGKLQSRSAELDTRTSELQAEVEHLQARMQAREASLAERLREMYMRPKTSFVAAALGSADMRKMSARVRALRHIASTERAMIDAFRHDQQSLRDKQMEIDASAAEIQMHQSEAREQQDKLASLRDERAETLGEVQRQQRSAQQTAAELERAAKALEDLIAKLEERRKSEAQSLSTAFASKKGQLPWPVRGQVIQRFGPATRPQLEEPIVSKGWKIRAAMGTPILSLAAGTVDFVDWLPGYGQCIIVNHGDGYYSLYAHASTVFPHVGASVEASEVIAEVGDTGSVEGSLLYLEIRQGRTPLDPGKWLAPAR